VKKRLTSMLALAIVAASLSFATVAVVAPAIVSAACSYGEIYIDEDHSGAGDTYYRCAGASGTYWNLASTPHTLPGACNAPLKVGDDWNNCVSSLQIKYFPDNKCLIVYDNTNATGDVLMVRWSLHNFGWNNFHNGQNLPYYIESINDRAGSIFWGFWRGNDCYRTPGS
jgi:hypothetical protein